jgi:hypothetical protein
MIGEPHASSWPALTALLKTPRAPRTPVRQVGLRVAAGRFTDGSTATPTSVGSLRRGRWIISNSASRGKPAANFLHTPSGNLTRTLNPATQCSAPDCHSHGVEVVIEGPDGKTQPVSENGEHAIEQGDRLVGRGANSARGGEKIIPVRVHQPDS